LRGLRIVNGEGFACGHLKIIGDGRMQVGVVIGGEAVLIGQAVEEGHGGIADDVGIAGVFFDNDEDVAKLRIGLSGDGDRRENICGPASATGKGKDETDESENKSKRHTLR
jgi:hypothetical protein